MDHTKVQPGVPTAEVCLSACATDTEFKNKQLTAIIWVSRDKGVCVCVCVHAHILRCTCGSQRFTPGTYLYDSQPSFRRKDLSLNLELKSSASCSRDPLVHSAHSSRVPNVGAQTPNSGPQASTAATSLTRPAPQSLNMLLSEYNTNKILQNTQRRCCVNRVLLCT